MCLRESSSLSAVCESLVAVVWKNRQRNGNLASFLQHRFTETGGGHWIQFESFTRAEGSVCVRLYVSLLTCATMVGYLKLP